MSSCTECGRKGGCSTRKGAMFEAIDEILARLYPDRRWGGRDEEAALDAGVSLEEGEALARTIAERMDVATRFVPGGPDEWCDYIYVLCQGRAPSIVDLREDQGRPRSGVPRMDASAEVAVESSADEAEDEALSDRYLRLALSSIARVVGVQEVAMRLRRHPDAVVVTEDVRGGVFDPILLKRFQTLVALLAETELRHLDFGEIVEPPPHFEGEEYLRQFGTAPVIANYLFSPRPVATQVTTILPPSIGV